MIKRFLSCFLLVISILLLFPLIAYADMVWTPPDDFYNANSSRCQSLNRNFYINSEMGYLHIKKEPGSETEVGVALNGNIFNVSFTYNPRGEKWGVIMFTSANGQQVTGWVPMDQLVLVYDKYSFMEDHSSEFYGYSGDYEALFEVDELVFWSWPGSGIITSVHSTQDNDLERDWLFASKAYKDSEGCEWGLIPYFYASRDLWICLSDPSNRDIPAFNPAPVPALWPSVDPATIPDTNKPWLSALLPIIILVVVLAIATAVLIRVFLKKKDAAQQ